MAEVKIVKYEKTEGIERNEKYQMDNMGHTNEKSEYDKFSNGAVYHERTPQNEKKSRAAKTWIAALFLALVALAAVAVALAIIVNQNKDNSKAVCTTEACVQAASMLIESIDQTADPCDDFFQYACGTWRKKNVIPEDKTITGVFSQAGDKLNVVLKYILSNPVQPSDIDAVEKTKNFYQSCMNEEQIEKIGLTTAQTIFAILGGWPVLGTVNGGNWREADFNVESILINNRQYGSITPIFVMFVYDDAKNPDKNVLYLDQSVSWGMPSREYFLRGRNDPLLKAYEQFAVDIAVAFGANPATAQVDMKNMVDFEIKLANLSAPAVQRIDEEKLYNKYILEKLNSEVSEFNWTKYVTETLGRDGVNINIAANETVVLRSPEYLKGVFKIVENTPSRTVQNYVVWRNIHSDSLMAALPQKIRDISKAYRKVLTGSSTPLPRWKTCATTTNTFFGEAVGKLYLKEAFDETAKENVLVMTNNLKKSVKGLLDDNEWMDEGTKLVAKEKVDFMEPRIGYPYKILSDVYLNEKYQNNTVDAEKYLKNLLDGSRIYAIQNLRKLRKPVDKESWDTTPADVNALYNPRRNQILFPAGILQPPLYKKDYPEYINYGGIGYVIGHEITHGFDSSGRMFDKYGNLRQWWNNASITSFMSRAQCMINQYGNYNVEEANENLNGILTLTENIADNGGLREAWRFAELYAFGTSDRAPILSAQTRI